MRSGHSGGMLLKAFDELCRRLRDECLRVYGSNLTSLVVFGSVGRGTPTHESDIDILLVAKELPHGRMARIRQFQEVEKRMSEDLLEVTGFGIHTRLSPLFRTESEMELGGLIFLDMVEDSKILVDRGGFFERYIASLREKLVSMGAIRVRRGSNWHWVLKPDLKPGEVFDI
ncbi:MAG TPA: nucleotidyltransferase domain-containing protein [Firmicutes bacterium]|nr:nucleotidyltransferase domain-containing protein [Candidatus Fermentithermobacillaceae bacterium]